MGVIDSAWFYHRLAEKGRSLREMARFMEIDPSAVSRMLSGERKMSAEEQDQISVFLGIGLEEVATHRRGPGYGLAEKKQAAYAAEPSPASEPVEMSTEDNIVYKDRKNWIRREDGSLRQRHPIFGCMRGTMTIDPDLDLTAPIEDVEWPDKLYNE